MMEEKIISIINNMNNITKNDNIELIFENINKLHYDINVLNNYLDYSSSKINILEHYLILFSNNIETFYLLINDNYYDEKIYNLLLNLFIKLFFLLRKINKLCA